MEYVENPPDTRLSPSKGRLRAGQAFLSYVTTTDHKKIGNMYLVTSFGFFMFAGLLAMGMRAELARPGMQIWSNQQYNVLVTIHGTIMLLLFATPTFTGFANAIMPLQTGPLMWPSPA